MSADKKCTNYYEFLGVPADAERHEIAEIILCKRGEIDRAALRVSSSEAKLRGMTEQLVYQELIFDEQLDETVQEDKRLYGYTNKLLCLHENLPIMKDRCIDARKFLLGYYKSINLHRNISLKLRLFGVNKFKCVGCVCATSRNRTEEVEDFLVERYNRILRLLEKHHDSVQAPDVSVKDVIYSIRQFTFYISEIDRMSAIVEREMNRCKNSRAVQDVRTKCDDLSKSLNDHKDLEATKEILEDISRRQSSSLRRNSEIVQAAAGILLDSNLRNLYDHYCTLPQNRLNVLSVTPKELKFMLEAEEHLVTQLHCIRDALRQILSAHRVTSKTNAVNVRPRSDNKYRVAFCEALHFVHLIKNQAVVESLKVALDNMIHLLDSVNGLIESCITRRKTMKPQARWHLFNTLKYLAAACKEMYRDDSKTA